MLKYKEPIAQYKQEIDWQVATKRDNENRVRKLSTLLMCQLVALPRSSWILMDNFHNVKNHVSTISIMYVLKCENNKL
jgi:hypothetical protein